MHCVRFLLDEQCFFIRLDAQMHGRPTTPIDDFLARAETQRLLRLRAQELVERHEIWESSSLPRFYCLCCGMKLHAHKWQYGHSVGRVGPRLAGQAASLEQSARWKQWLQCRKM